MLGPWAICLSGPFPLDSGLWSGEQSLWGAWPSVKISVSPVITGGALFWILFGYLRGACSGILEISGVLDCFDLGMFVHSWFNVCPWEVRDKLANWMCRLWKGSAFPLPLPFAFSPHSFPFPSLFPPRCQRLGLQGGESGGAFRCQVMCMLQDSGCWRLGVWRW